MIVFPNAKINVGLNITGVRKNGYHDIESVFYPIPLRDVLEVVAADDGVTEMRVGGLPLEGDVNDNSVLKAYRLLKEQYDLPAVKIYLEKVPEAAPAASPTWVSSNIWRNWVFLWTWLQVPVWAAL